MFEEHIRLNHEQFAINGTFKISAGSELRSAIREFHVPAAPGIYIIYRESVHPKNILYIGKAGTMKTDGTFKDQGLSRRLCAKQYGMPRPEYFQKKMNELQIVTLHFQWFVTFMKENKILPAKAEADLLQTYYDTFKMLPLWNNSI